MGVRGRVLGVDFAADDGTTGGVLKGGNPDMVFEFAMTVLIVLVRRWFQC